MKISTTLVLSLATFSMSFAQKYWDMINEGQHSVQEIQKEAESYFKDKYQGKGSGYKQYKRWEYFALKDADVNNRIDWRGTADIEVLKFKKRALTQGHAFAKKGSELWTELGPSVRNPTSSWNPGLGRVESISVDPSNPNHILTGTPTGGAWVTIDGGTSWTPLTDNLPTMDMFSCAISPHNSQIYFIGTNQGIYRSLDQGISWTKITSSKTVRIKPDPNDPNIIIACGTFGISRSTNGGNSFTTVKSGSTLDLEYHPTNSNIVYASGGGFYKSTNNGVSFTTINGPSGSYSRLALSEAEPSSVWLATTSGSNFSTLYKSTNSGTSFTSIHTSSTDYFEGYGWYGIDLAVSNEDPNKIYMGGMELFRSTNGGASFSLYIPWTYSGAGAKYIHADIHALEWANGTLYTGTDGGISQGLNSESSFKDLSNGLNTRQFYTIDISETDPTKVVGGAQDNGTISTYGTNYNWQEWLGADGMDCFVSRFNSNNQVGTSQNGSLYKTTNGGQSRSGMSGDDGNWVTPVAEDPVQSDVFYVGYTAVKKYSFNSGTGVNLGTPPGSGKCDVLKVAESNNQIMFAAKGSTLSKSTNGGNSWTQLTTGLGSINDIDIHPSDPNIVVIASSGSSKVYYSSNGGNNWTGMLHNLPNISANCVAIADGNADAIYVGMYSGVYYIDNTMAEWIDFQDNLPNVRINELIISKVNDRVYAGTYGRGSWSAPTFATANQINTSITANSAINFCEGNDVVIEAVNEPNYTYQWLKDGGNIQNANNYSYTANESGSYSVEITSEGETVESDPIIVTVNTSAQSPTVEDQAFCFSGDQVIFTANNPVGEIRWFENQNNATPISTGNSFTANPTQTTTFYVEQGSAVNSTTFGGALDTTESTGGNHAGGYGLEFNVAKAMVLMDVDVYAQGAGERNFVLKNSNGDELYNINSNLVDGKNTITLDWTIDLGTGYIISCEKINGEDANLYRNNNFSSFPFDIGNIATVTQGTASGVETEYYYYFYNWKVKEDVTDCPSSKVPVQATLNICTSTEDIAEIGVTAFPNPVTETLQINLNNAFEGILGANWEITTLEGKIVNKGKMNYSQMINVNSLANGAYLLNIQLDGITYSTEIIKK